MELERIETKHNTPEQVAEYLEAAQQIADTHGVDREREPEVFCKILDMCAAKQLTVIQQPVSGFAGGVQLPPRH